MKDLHEIVFQAKAEDCLVCCVGEAQRRFCYSLNRLVNLSPWLCLSPYYALITSVDLTFYNDPSLSEAEFC